jgi:hypothetical protein
MPGDRKTNLQIFGPLPGAAGLRAMAAIRRSLVADQILDLLVPVRWDPVRTREHDSFRRLGRTLDDGLPCRADVVLTAQGYAGIASRAGFVVDVLNGFRSWPVAMAWATARAAYRL